MHGQAIHAGTLSGIIFQKRIERSRAVAVPAGIRPFTSPSNQTGGFYYKVRTPLALDGSFGIQKGNIPPVTGPLPMSHTSATTTASLTWELRRRSQDPCRSGSIDIQYQAGLNNADSLYFKKKKTPQISLQVLL